jgi:predicted acetyltransferase
MLLEKNGKKKGSVKMVKLYLEVPSLKRKEEAIEYIKEHLEVNSPINGAGGLKKYLDNYEGWLEKLEEDYVRIPDEEKVPARTYFLVREDDNKIIGMINIRLALNEALKKFGGHIGYGIRPSERGKGYNKINLYLGLKVCAEYGIDTVLLDADLDNPASWRTMESLGGIRVKEFYDDVNAHCVVVDYNIDVKKSLIEHQNLEEYISNNNSNIKSI